MMPMTALHLTSGFPGMLSFDRLEHLLVYFDAQPTSHNRWRHFLRRWRWPNIASPVRAHEAGEVGIVTFVKGYSIGRLY